LSLVSLLCEFLGRFFVAETNSAQWSFMHKIVDKQYYTASLGIAVFFFSAVIAV